MRTGRRRIRRWTWARRGTAFAFLALLTLGCFAWFPWFKGSTTATWLFDFAPLADPLAAVEVVLATRSLQSSVLVGAALLLAFCFLMGPVFCGWVCPLGLLLDLNQGVRERVRRWFGRRRPQLPRIRIPSTIKYGMLGLVLGFSLMGQLPAFQTISPINVVGWSLLEIIESLRRAQFSPIGALMRAAVFSLGPALLFVAGIVLVEYVSPRLWCRSLCPLGAFYGLVGRWGLLRVRVNPAEAGKAACRHCTLHCPMGIRVMEDYSRAGKPSVDDPDCTRCGACVDACPRGVLKLGFTSIPRSAAPNEACCICPAGSRRGGQPGDREDRSLPVISSGEPTRRDRL